HKRLAAGAAQRDDTDAVVRLDFVANSLQPVVHRPIQGIVHIGPIEHDRRPSTGFLEYQFVVRHVVPQPSGASLPGPEPAPRRALIMPIIPGANRMKTANASKASAIGRWRKMERPPPLMADALTSDVSNILPSTRPSTSGAAG